MPARNPISSHFTSPQLTSSAPNNIKFGTEHILVQTDRVDQARTKLGISVASSNTRGRKHRSSRIWYMNRPSDTYSAHFVITIQVKVLL